MNYPKYRKFFDNFENTLFNDRETRQCLENTAFMNAKLQI